jgi:predicted HicB family RNase H-like nuclease
MVTPKGTVQVSIRIAAALRRAIKIEAIRRDTSVNALVEEWIRDGLKRKEA